MKSGDKNKLFVSLLLKWSKKNIRDFPWRTTVDPYSILIAEIMLQRTKVKQVVPIYMDFLESYPDIFSLSKASDNEIKNKISGLGLAKRAKGIQKLADQIIKDYKGKIPAEKNKLLNLHGVGNYISNALLCHAFNQNVPTVDANFARVLKRIFSLNLKKPEQKDKTLWVFAEDLIQYAQGNCSLFNLGIIDLANLICTSRKPSCCICPCISICEHGQSCSIKMMDN